MLKDANAVIKNGMMRLKHLTGDGSYMKWIKMDEVKTLSKVKAQMQTKTRKPKLFGFLQVYLDQKL